MSGMTPVRLKDGGFPDLTGDGKVTQKDILKGRGIEGFADGGDADKRFMNLQRTAEGSGANLRDFTDLVFDPTDPVDYAIAGLMVFPPAAIAAKLIKLGVKGNKLKNKMKKVEVMKDAQRSMGTKAKDLFTTNPIDNMAAANGLVLGGTRATALGATGQLALRNELADMATTNERTISRIGPAELYSYEARDQIKEDPSLVKKGGIGDLVEIAQLVPEFYDIAKDPEGREAMAEVIKESLPSMPNVFGTVDDEILNRRDGGIAGFKKGGIVVKGIKEFTQKVKLKKDGTPYKNTPTTILNNDGTVNKNLTKQAEKILKDMNKKAVDKPKSSGTKINEKIKESKPKQTPAQKKAAAERKRQATNKKAAQQRQADIDAKAKANADARRKADTDEFNQSRQQTPATKVDDAATGGTPKTGGGVPEGNATKPGFFQKAKKPALIGGALVAGASLIPGMFDDADGSEEDRPATEPLITDSPFDFNNSGGNTTLVDTDPTAWAQIMKDRIVNDRGIPLDDQGNFTEKPKFMDYLKSLPGAYSDKVQRDPDFAKKMMAGFLNMMKPVEGYVPINSAVAFGEGYLGEETRQANMLPADAKMLKFLQANPDLYDKYLESESAKAGVLLSDIKAEQGTTLFNQLVDTVAGKQNISLDQVAKGNYQLTYQGRPVGPSDITSILDQGVSILGNPDFKLEIK